MKKTKLLSIAAAILLAGCSTLPNSANETKPAWLPKRGERVATNYSESAPNHIGPERIVTVTRARKYKGEYRVYSQEYRHGIPLDMVAPWDTDAGTDSRK